MIRPSDDGLGRFVGVGTALLSIIGFWLFYFVLISLRAAVMDFDDQSAMMARRGVVAVVGVLITFGLYTALRPFTVAALRWRIAAAAILSIPFAAMFAAFNYAAFYVYEPMSPSRTVVQQSPAPRPARSGGSPVTLDRPGKPPFAPHLMIADGTVTWYFFFAAWSAMYLALGYAAEVSRADRRAATADAGRREAELRALRYQINPHFLFNTLNSLSTLVLRDRRDEAETMIMNLATFFRTSLTADPAEDISLAEELRLQRLYLDIEAVRFPDRLRIAYDVPDDLLDACVPCLLLQPLIENAIKHGVARSKGALTLSIRAREEAGGLSITVEDDGPAPRPDFEPFDDRTPVQAPVVTGTGTGLRNVRERLAARFGKAAGARWGARPGGGFGVALHMPLVRNDC